MLKKDDLPSRNLTPIKLGGKKYQYFLNLHTCVKGMMLEPGDESSVAVTALTPTLGQTERCEILQVN
jgi:hypothetical protein